MFFDQFFQRNTHFFLDGARIVDMSGDTEELGARVAVAAEGSKPATAAAGNSRGYGDGFDVGDRGRASKKANGGRKGWLEARFAWFSFKRFDQGGLLAANVSTHAAVEKDVKVVAAAASVFANQSFFVGFLNGTLQYSRFMVEFAPNVYIGCGAVHGSAGNEAAFD